MVDAPESINFYLPHITPWHLHLATSIVRMLAFTTTVTNLARVPEYEPSKVITAQYPLGQPPS